MNKESMAQFKRMVKDVDLSCYTTGEIAKMAKTASGGVRDIYISEIMVRCENIFSYYSRKYGGVLDVDMREEMMYDALKRSLDHFETNNNAKFETYFSNQVRMTFMYEYRKLHCESPKQRAERVRRDQLRASGVDISELEACEPLEYITKDADLRNKLDLETQDLMINSQFSESQTNQLLEIELLEMFTEEQQKLVKILISSNDGKDTQINLMNMIGIDIQNNGGKLSACNKSYKEYNNLLNGIKETLIEHYGEKVIQNHIQSTKRFVRQQESCMQ